MAAGIEAKLDRLFEHPFTAIDLQVGLVMVGLGILAAVFLKMRGELHAGHGAWVTGVAAFVGAWLTHNGRLAGLLGVQEGLWEMLVPALLAGTAGAPLAQKGRAPFASLGWFLWWGAAVRGAYLLLALYRQLR